VVWTPLRGGYGAAPSGSSGGWIMSVLDLSSYAGEMIKIRFYFDTDDGIANDYPGWFFDDVLVTAAGVVWLSVDPTSGAVPADSSMDIEVTFDATGLFGGDFFSDIVITSNDPDEPEVIVPTHLHVIGVPDIELSPDTLNFDSVFVDDSDTLELQVSNIGTDILVVSNITTDNVDYSVDTTNFNLPPNDSQTVLVIFTPSSVGLSTGNLIVESNDPDEPMDTVALIGIGMTGIAEGEVAVPKIFSVSQNFPNPFSQQTVIRYACPYRTKVALKIFDVTGRLIKTLLDEKVNAGYYSIRWDGKDKSGKKVASGIYHLKFTASPLGTTGSGGKVEDYKETKKLLLIR